MVEIICSGITLIGVIITCYFSNRGVRDALSTSLDKHQAVQDEKIEELTREVRLHNDFARRIPVVETKLDNIEKRVSNLESK